MSFRADRALACAALLSLLVGVGSSGCEDFATNLLEPGGCDASDLACTACHGSGDSPAPPVDLHGSDSTAEIGVGAHASHLSDNALRRAVPCESCHQVPSSVNAAGHIDPSPAELVWSGLATGDSTPVFDRDRRTCSNYCHGATLTGGSNTTPEWTVVDGTQAACGTCHGTPPPAPHPASSGCGQCHVETLGTGEMNLDTHIDGVLQVSGSLECGSCHAVPPATGSHLVHYSASTQDATYGDTSITEALLPGGGGYAFGCGNCHPTDPSHHGNGVTNAGGGSAEIQLSPGDGKPGSLKARNGPNAAYDPGPLLQADGDGLFYTLGTCSEVYCHSQRVIDTPGPVPAPGQDFPFTGYPITYPEYVVNTTRLYRDVTWGDTLSCDGCHGFPPRTFDATVLAGAGDSHSWINAEGYESLHGFVHGADPVPCSACHNEVVTDPGVRYRDYEPPADGWSVYEPVPIAGHGRHVNGVANVAFTTDPITLTSNQFDLSSAAWDSSTRSCESVSCHLQDTPVVWGTPFRYSVGAECNVCHRM